MNREQLIAARICLDVSHDKNSFRANTEITMKVWESMVAEGWACRGESKDTFCIYHLTDEGIVELGFRMDHQ